VKSRQPRPQPSAAAEDRVRRSQRLRAIATVLALTAVMLVISAIGVAAAVLRGGGSDSRATHNLELVVQTVQAMQRNAPTGDKQGGFSGVTAASLSKMLPSITFTDRAVSSGDDQVVSMDVSSAGGTVFGWYGAVLSKSGHCFAAGADNVSPKVMTVVLPGNCTGDAARATLMPLTAATPSMARTPAPASAASG
jgi:hypothetical protein